jgi:aspartyl-tRNA(Asn)/glutamyl-tRNA(Gln) amidotransferase subunit C
MALEPAAVVHIAALARIRIGEAELEGLTTDLSRILAWFEQLNELDTSGVPPMASAVAARLPMREDRVSDGDCRDAILSNAPGRPRGAVGREFFAVPKVLE